MFDGVETMKWTMKSSSNLAFWSISGGSWETSFAVATTNTADVFSCIHDKNVSNTHDEVLPAVNRPNAFVACK